VSTPDPQSLEPTPEIRSALYVAAEQAIATGEVARVTLADGRILYAVPDVVMLEDWAAGRELPEQRIVLTATDGREVHVFADAANPRPDRGNEV